MDNHYVQDFSQIPLHACLSLNARDVAVISAGCWHRAELDRTRLFTAKSLCRQCGVPQSASHRPKSTKTLLSVFCLEMLVLPKELGYKDTVILELRLLD